MTEIVRNLHQMGSSNIQNREGDFDLIVDMAGVVSQERNLPVLRFPIPDAEMIPNPEPILALAVAVAERVKVEKKVAVVCAAGQNRSGLVVALALLRLGYRAQAAIDLIQEKREGALANPHFREYILR